MKKDTLTAVRSLVWPVCLIGAKQNEKHNVMTAAWVTQVSADPLLVLVSIATGRYTHDLIARTGEFVVSILGRGQEQISSFCGSRSGRDADKIAHLKLTTLPPEAVQVPRLAGCIANLECKMVAQYSAGDHTLFVGEVVAADVSEAEVAPLIMYRSKTGIFQ